MAEASAQHSSRNVSIPGSYRSRERYNDQQITARAVPKVNKPFRVEDLNKSQIQAVNRPNFGAANNALDAYDSVRSRTDLGHAEMQ